MRTHIPTTFLPEYKYSVTASWKYKDDDSESFCNAVEMFAKKDPNFIQSQLRMSMKLLHITFSTPFECFSFIFPNAYMDGELMRANFTNYDFYRYYHLFYDSYDEWMSEFLCKTMRFLADGSRVNVVSDYSKYSLVVENGEVKKIEGS